MLGRGPRGGFQTEPAGTSDGRVEFEDVPLTREPLVEQTHEEVVSVDRHLDEHVLADPLVPEQVE